MIGYKQAYSSLEVNHENMTIPQVQLDEDTQQLDEVVVTARKPLYEKQIDRTVVNVQSSITSSGKTALEVIEKSPGVNVNRQNNSLSMNGKTGVQVMINGKMSRLPIDAVVQMLDGMSAANIDKIELIITPPAKYDAEGDARIINIVMIENADSGTNGNFGLTGGYNKGETLGTNFNFNHRSNRYSFFVDYSILSDHNEQPWINKRTIKGEEFDRTVVSTSQRDSRTTVQNFRTGLAYDISSKTSAKLLLTGYRRNWDMDAATENVNVISPDLIITTDMDLHESNIWQSASASFGMSHQITNRQRISFDFDYLYYVNDNPSRYDNSSFSNESSTTEGEIIEVTKDTPINFKIAQFDYSNQINEKFSVDVGVKTTFPRFNNNVEVQSFVQEQWVTNNQLTNTSNLDEKIMAGYASWKWEPTTNLMINGGLRYEYTDSYLSSPEEKGLVDREFGNLFPSLFYPGISTKKVKSNWLMPKGSHALLLMI